MQQMKARAVEENELGKLDDVMGGVFEQLALLAASLKLSSLTSPRNSSILSNLPPQSRGGGDGVTTKS